MGIIHHEQLTTRIDSWQSFHHQMVKGMQNFTSEWLVASHTCRHTHLFNVPLSGTTRVSRYQKGKTDLDDFTEARDSEWHWHLLGHMQVCTSLQSDNHASTPLNFLQAGCPSCRPTNGIKALKVNHTCRE